MLTKQFPFWWQQVKFWRRMYKSHFQSVSRMISLIPATFLSWQLLYLLVSLRACGEKEEEVRSGSSSSVLNYSITVSSSSFFSFFSLAELQHYHRSVWNERGGRQFSMPGDSSKARRVVKKKRIRSWKQRNLILFCLPPPPKTALFKSFFSALWISLQASL